MRMLNSNAIPGLLPLRGRGMDGSSCYDYDVSGKISVKALYERAKMSREDLQHFLAQLRAVLKEVERYLLHVEAVLLDPEYLFYEDGTFFFCYYPPSTQDFWKEFHVLTEYLVKRADYNDTDCAKMVMYLHKETMKENYSLEKVIEGCLKAEDIKEKQTETDEETEPGYDSKEHEWIAAQEAGSSIMKETDHMWTPMKRFLNRRKKQKWGDWDGLYIEEEELN